MLAPLKKYEGFTELIIEDVLKKLEGSHDSFKRFYHPDPPSKIVIIGNLADKEKDYSLGADSNNLSAVTKSSMKHNAQFIHFLVSKTENSQIIVDFSYSLFYRVFPTFDEQNKYWKIYGQSAEFYPVWKRIDYSDSIMLPLGQLKKENANFLDVIREIRSDEDYLKYGKIKEFYKEKKESENLEELYYNFISGLKEKENQVDFKWDLELNLSYEDYNAGTNIVTISLTNNTPELKKEYYDSFIYNVKMDINLQACQIIPFKFHIYYEDHEISKNSYAKGVNCQTYFDSENNVLSTRPYGKYKQARIIPRTNYENIALKFSDLKNNPVEILESLIEKMNSLLDTYKEDTQYSNSPEFQSETNHFETVVKRYVSGIECLKTSEKALRAFTLLQETFEKASKYPNWRIFQIVFIVSLIPDLINRENDLGKELRKNADILHVNTGGGKSETYFGIVVFLMFYNRLDDKLFGTSAITKFPLRMLSIQQLQRVANVIIWAEEIRKEKDIPGEPFSLGYYVGNDRGEFPRYATDSIEQLKKNENEVAGLIIDKCPICENRVIENRVIMTFDETLRRVYHECVSCSRKFNIYITDEEIYRYLPTLIISTVDKLSSISSQRRLKNLLAGELEYCENHGFRPKGDKCDGNPPNCNLVKYNFGNKRHAPELVIQDEMHLISEAFGTIDSHFESLYDELIQKNAGWSLKYLGMTATISGVNRQIKQLYNRETSVFPGKSPYGQGKNDFFFEKVQESGIDSYQRFIIGLKPNMRDNQYASLLTIRYLTEFIQHVENNKESYCQKLTITMEQLDEIIKYYKRYLTYHYKKSDVHSMEFFIRDVAESALKDAYSISSRTLTGDNSLNEIKETIDYIDKFLSDPNDTKKTNVTFATSIVSHGVDINYWNVMVFQGIPKKTSEYIQALSRVGRQVTGLIFLWFYPNRARDLSFYHNFNDYHQMLEYKVEEIPILRWSPLGLKQTFTSVFNASILNYFSNKLKRPLYKVDEVKEIFSLDSNAMNNRQDILQFINKTYLVDQNIGIKGVDSYRTEIPSLMEERLNFLFRYDKYANKNFFPNALADSNDKYFRTQRGMRGIEDSAIINPYFSTAIFLNKNNLNVGSLFEPDYSSSSSLFHIIPGLIISRGKFAFQAYQIMEDASGDRNIKIHNKERLKNRTLERIILEYNMRIDRRKMKLVKVTPGMDTLFNVKLIKFIDNKIRQEEGDFSDFSGYHQMNPLSFVCKNKKCGNARLYFNFKQLQADKFDIHKCISCDSGSYEQIKLLFYCDICGTIRPMYWECPQTKTLPRDKKHKIKMVRTKLDSLRTWNFECQECKTSETTNVFRFTCNHINTINKQLLLDKEKFNKEEWEKNKNGKFNPLTVIEGAIYLPVSYTTVDIPNSGEINIYDIEIVLVGLYLHEFDSLKSRRNPEINLETIKNVISRYNNSLGKNDYIEQKEDELDREINSPDEQEELWRKFTKYDIYLESIERLHSIVIDDDDRKIDLTSFNDYLALIGHFQDRNNLIAYDNFLNDNFNGEELGLRLEAYRIIKEHYGIGKIQYLPEVTLISVCYGLINGVNEFWEPDFTPHFDLLYNNKFDGINKGFNAFAYPYETEGILFEMDRVRLWNWLANQKNLSSTIESDNQAKKELLKMTEDAENLAKKLLHTISHVLINTSSIRTGIDSDSCGEIIFPRAGAIFLYSKSTINTGGFQYIFENEISNWLRAMEEEIRDCILDENCIKTSGSCFSCLYLPEFVCSYFNHDLDRDILLGKYRYKEGYWSNA